MILLKFYIFLTLFLLTKQELFWKFLSSNEFSTEDNNAMLDMRQFTMYNNSNNYKNRLCLIFLSVGHVYISSEFECSHQCTKNVQLNERILQSNNSSWPKHHGKVKTSKFLRTYDNKDGLIFVSLEGCYTIDENGTNSTGTFIITNNITIEYNQILNYNYFWTNIRVEKINCNILCEDLFFERCYVEMNEVEKTYFRRVQIENRNGDLYLSPLKQVSNYFSYNKVFILIVFVILYVIISICTWYMCIIKPYH